jgi:uncharacterized membrane protein
MNLSDLTHYLPPFLTGSVGWGLLLLRVIWGMTLVRYSLPMIRNPFHWLDLGGKPSGFPGFLQAIGAFAIFLGGIAIILGFLTPLAALGLGFVGVTTLVGWKTFAATPSFFAAVGAGLLAALLYAIAAPYAKHQLTGVPPLVIATISQLSAAVFLLPALPFTVPKTAPTPMIVLSVLALALASTAVAYVLYFRLIQNVGSTKALTVTYLIPAFAMVWGSVILKEPITASMALGCGLILMGTAIANDLFKGLLVKH